MKPATESHAPSILVVDDDQSLASTLKDFLTREGYFVEVALSGAEALAIQAANPHIALALVDLVMPVMGGLALTDELRRRDPELTVVIMTGYATIETAVDAIKRGAEDYVTKPFDFEGVRKKLGRLMEVVELRERVAQLEKHLERHPCFENIISLSASMERVLERARMAAGTDASVLLLGETGTGKEMLARAIHAASARARMPFVAVNSGALPHELVESELFGFRKGAFTGAYADAPGIFSAATGGTVFLDELGEMPKDVQVKLLRVAAGKGTPPGGRHPRGPGGCADCGRHQSQPQRTPLHPAARRSLLPYRHHRGGSPAAAHEAGGHPGALAAFRGAPLAPLRPRDLAGAPRHRTPAGLRIPRQCARVGESHGKRRGRLRGQSPDRHR